MRPLFLLIPILLLLGSACGTQSTLPLPTDDATATLAHTPAPSPSTAPAAAGTPTPTKRVSKALTPTPKPTPKPTLILPPVSTTVPEGRIVENATLVRLGPEPPTLDPHLTVDTNSALYIVEIFGGLVTIDANLLIVPDLAEDWDISNGGRTYTFHLREDAKFHNGKPVTARDFKWSMERVADPRTESPVADVFLGDIVGFKDKLVNLANEIATTNWERLEGLGGEIPNVT